MASSEVPDLKELIWQNEKSFLTFSGISILAGFIVAYGIWEIAKAFYKYKDDHKQHTITYKPVSSDNYDIVKTSDDLQYRDDTVFTQNLLRSLNEYRIYNERLKNYYKEYRPDEIPKDIIDRSILDPKADNY